MWSIYSVKTPVYVSKIYACPKAKQQRFKLECENWEGKARAGEKVLDFILRHSLLLRLISTRRKMSWRATF